MDKERIQEFLAHLETDRESWREATILLREGLEKIREGIARLEGPSATKVGIPRRVTGRGVTVQEALLYAESARREAPDLTASELEARVTKRAIADGKSPKGLVARLRRALAAQPPRVLESRPDTVVRGRE